MKSSAVRTTARTVARIVPSTIRWTYIQQSFHFCGSTTFRSSSSAQVDLAWFERSEQQNRANNLEYERMVHVAERICQTPEINATNLYEIRQVFQYFSGNRSRGFVSEVDHAGVLWKTIMEHGSDENIRSIVRTDDCTSACLVDLMEQYLFPFRGTSSATKIGDRRQHGNKDSLLLALTRASKVENDIQQLLQRGILKQDNLTCNAILALWSHRSLFLKDFGCKHLDETMIRESLGGITNVEDCLLKMEDIIHEFLRSPLGIGTSNMYNILIGAWTNSGLDKSIDKVHEVLDMMEANPSITTDVVTYNSILHAYSKRAHIGTEFIKHTSQLFDRMKELEKVDVVSYSTLILAYTKAGLPRQGEEFLEEMEQSAKESGIYPNVICYNTLLDAYSLEGTVAAAQRAEALVEKMTQVSESGENTSATPDRFSYTSVIKAWRNSGSRSAAERAEAILFRCQELSDDDSAMKPDTVMFNTVLSVWTKVSEVNRGSEVGALRADKLFSRMKADVHTQPDTTTYNSVMHAWAKSDSPNATARVLDLLNEMKRSENQRCKPDHHTYNTVLNALATSRNGRSAQLVEEFLEEMKTAGIPPTVIQYNTLMNAIVTQNGKVVSKESLQRIEGILQMMEVEFMNGNTDLKPNMHTYNTVMNAYSKSSDPCVSKKINDILQRIPKSGQFSSTISLNTLIDAHARAGRADAAESVLRDMLAIPELKVSTINFNTVINAYSKSDDPDAPLRAEALLSEMYNAFEAGNIGIKPDAITFSSAINCWAQSTQTGAAERAEAILNRMHELFIMGHEDLEPTAVAYSTTISAWARSGVDAAPERAKALLRRMQESHASGKLRSRPSHYCYNAVLNAIAKGKGENKVSEAVAMLEEMKQAFKDGNRDARPSNTSYATVLNACAFVNGTPAQKMEAFETARGVFKELLQTEYCEPNVVVFINFLTCCGLLIPQGDYRTKMACAIFRQCYQSGMMHEKLTTGLKRSVAAGTFQLEMNTMAQYMKGAGQTMDRPHSNDR